MLPGNIQNGWHTNPGMAKNCGFANLSRPNISPTHNTSNAKCGSARNSLTLPSGWSEATQAVVGVSLQQLDACCHLVETKRNTLPLTHHVTLVLCNGTVIYLSAADLRCGSFYAYVFVVVSMN